MLHAWQRTQQQGQGINVAYVLLEHASVVEAGRCDAILFTEVNPAQTVS